jgi:ferredoxin-nitrate reductase
LVEWQRLSLSFVGPAAAAARAQCPYCGVGCGLELRPPTAGADEPVWVARGDRHHPSSLGQVCVKGATVGATLHGGRLTTPLWRADRREPLRPIDWDEALGRLVDAIRGTLATQGPDGLALYGSGQFLSEDYYLAQKLFKGFLGCNHVDANSRLCMSSAVSGYAHSLGADGPPCCYDDLDLADVVVLIGTNTAECHPVLWQRLLKRRRRDPGACRLIVIDPRRTATAAAADLHLALQPGSDLALLLGLGHRLLQRGALDRAFVAAHTSGSDDWIALAEAWPPARSAAVCGIAAADLIAAADAWAGAERVLSAWSMGVNQSSEGSATVSGIINLHLLTGQIGRPGAGPFSLTGQPNAMGGREAGGLAQLLPGYRSIADPTHRADLERHWGLAPGAIHPQPGRTVWEQVQAMERGELGLWWVAATNPLVSLPWLDRVRQAVAHCPLVVLSEAYAGTETEAVAHLVLPAAQWSEKTGVMTNSERRVTLCPAFRPPPGEARADWAILADLGRRLGFREAFAYPETPAGAAAIHAEFVAITAGRPCDMAGLSHGLLAAHGPQQWPFPAGTAPGGGQARLYTDHRFATRDGRARFQADAPGGAAEPPCDDYPLVLTVGRYLGHWHTMTRTARVERLRNDHPEARLEVHPDDAGAAGLEDGGWAHVTSRRATIAARVLVTDAIRPGTVFLPMHWGAAQPNPCEANRLMHDLCCPRSRQPELKGAAVRLRRLTPEKTFVPDNVNLGPMPSL